MAPSMLWSSLGLGVLCLLFYCLYNLKTKSIRYYNDPKKDPEVQKILKSKILFNVFGHDSKGKGFVYTVAAKDSAEALEVARAEYPDCRFNHCNLANSSYGSDAFSNNLSDQNL